MKKLIVAEMYFSGEMSSDLEIAVQYVDFILRWVRTCDTHTSNSYPYTAQYSYFMPYCLYFLILVLIIAIIISKVFSLTPNFGLDTF